MDSEIIIAADPGFGGAVCALFHRMPIIYDMPVKKIPKSNRKEYDILKLVTMLQPYTYDKKVHVVTSIEKVHSMTGEGTASSFSFGKGFGMLQGIFTSMFSQEPALITPQQWKSSYPELTAGDEVEELKDSLKALRAQYKCVKDKERKETIKKEIDATSRKIKSYAKDAARFLAARFYPDIAGVFKLKKDDGRAEATLLARHVRDNL